MLVGVTSHRSLGRTIAGLKGRAVFSGLLLIAVNWPLVFVWIEPSGKDAMTALAAAGVLGAATLCFGRWHYGLAAERSMAAILIVAVMSASAVAIYTKLGDTIRTLEKVEPVSAAAAVPRWGYTGKAQSHFLSAIPSSSNKTIICATPMFLPDGAGPGEAVSWLIQKRVHRSFPAGWSQREVACDKTASGEPPALIPLPDRSHSPLVLEAIHNSMSRFGIATRQVHQIFLRVDHSERELVLRALGLAGAVTLLNALLFSIMSAMVKSKFKGKYL